MRTRERGFTLIELMVAIAILALMMLVGWGVTNQMSKAKKKYGAEQDRWREARLAMSRMTRDFSMAYLGGNEDRTREVTRTFFIGEPESDIDTVRFSTFVHTPLYADANESDQTVVSYAAEPDLVDRRKTNLVRHESRRLSGDKQEQTKGATEILFSDVAKLELGYWDVRTKEWRDTWSSAGSDVNANRLPDRVRIKISFLDENGKEITLTTQARVYLQETISFVTN
jgi:general secretion pathway protein J